MNKLVHVSLLVACLVALSQGAEPSGRLEVSAQKGGPSEHAKVSLGKSWESRDGQWSAGAYVQRSKDRFPGGPTVRDTQAGFEVKGKFKG